MPEGPVVKGGASPSGNISGNILVRGVNWVGDAVMTLPALRAIRRAFPDSRISLLVKPSVSPLFEKSPYIDEIITYDERFKGIMGRLNLTRELKQRGFSRAILLQNAFGAALITALAAIPDRTGYDRDGRGFMLTRRVPYRGEDRRNHHIQYFLELLRRSGIEASPSEPWIHLGLEERLEARNRLSTLKRPVVGLNPGAAFGSAKRWPAERFANVAHRVINDLGGSAVIFGSANDAPLAEEIADSTRGNVKPVSLAGKTTLRELAATISECDALVTTDSGPMHVGYAVKTPLVAVFGSTDPALTGPPPGPGNVVIKKIIDCGPCFQRECTQKSIRCMLEVSADEVFDAVKSLLPTQRAVFFDRDGTLCEDANFLKTWDDFKVFSDVSSLNELINNGFMLIGATNQSGITRGIVDEGFVGEVNTFFMEKHGFRDFYYCPHHPDEGCSCRKPEPGMLLKARADHRVDLRRSYMVGDNEKDMLLARAVGSKAVLVRTGKLERSENADFTAGGLSEAVDWIIRDAKGTH